MKYYITLISMVTVLYYTSAAQNQLYIDGATLYISAGSTMQVNSSFANTSISTFNNNGTVTITGNIINNQTISGYTVKLIFNGTAAQAVGGTVSILTKDFEINNAAGLTLNAKLVVDGSCAFTNGIIAAGDLAKPLALTSNATYTGGKCQPR